MQFPEVSRERVCFIALKARELNVQHDIVGPDDGPDAGDEKFGEVLETCSADPTFEEVRSAIDSLSVEHQCNLVALAWVGRGDYYADEWGSAIETARQQHTEHTGLYLNGMPLLSDYLLGGLSEIGMSCEDVEIERL